VLRCRTLAWQWSIHDHHAYRSTARCRSLSAGVDAPGSEPCGFETFFYAGPAYLKLPEFTFYNVG
jgi:hypothetical protein